ncbi:hypothetical protein WICMUC_002982, partial [Wickerhamomyces mucosus]
MTIVKKQKIEQPKKKKTLIINAAGNGAAGNWRHPTDRSSELGYSIDAWIEYAKIAERGKLNALFIADHLSPFTSKVEGDSSTKFGWEDAARAGVNISRF